MAASGVGLLRNSSPGASLWPTTPPGRSLPLTAPGAKTALLRFWQSTGARNCACQFLAIYFPFQWTVEKESRLPFSHPWRAPPGALLGCSGAGGPVCATSPRATVWATRGGPCSSVGGSPGALEGSPWLRAGVSGGAPALPRGPPG